MTTEGKRLKAEAQELIADAALIKFLKEHRPVPPMVDPSLEGHLMAAIQVESNLKRGDRVQPHRYFWIVSGAIVTASALFLGSQQFFAPRLQTASELAELEAFLVENWDETVTEPTLTSNSVDSDWLLLTELPNSKNKEAP